MQRVLIFGSVFLAFGAMGVTRFRGLEERLEELDRLRREVPENARLVQSDLTRLEDELGSMRREVEEARAGVETDRAALDDAERRLDRIAATLDESRASLARQEASWTERVEAHAREIAELQQGVEARWDGLAATVQATATLARQTSSELGALHATSEPSEETRWHQMVGPTVQLAGETTVGSGVLLESSESPDEPGSYETLMLTAWHVVRDIRADSTTEDPPIPVAIYLQSGERRHEQATLLAHDADLDIALLRLDSTEPVPNGATLPTREDLDRLRIFRTIYAVGCPLGNDPIPTRGELADLDHHIDGGTYWMISAPTYIGNSGGGIYDGDSRALLGIFSKIYTHGSMRPTVVPHMGLVTPMPLVYEWLESNGYAELVPSERGVALSVAGDLHR